MLTVSTNLQQYDNGFQLFQKEHFTDQYQLSITVALGSTFLIEYQKDLLDELRGDVQDIVSESKKSTSQIQKQLERILHNFNTQLSIFGEKSKHENPIELRGSLQIWSDDYYIASLIGSMSLVIYRKKKLIHHVINHVNTNQKISFFSELVDGKIVNGDIIVLLGGDISIAMDQDDLEHVGPMMSSDYTFFDIMQETVNHRIDLKDFVYIIQQDITYNSGGIFGKKINLENGSLLTGKTISRFVNNKFVVIITGLVFLLIYLIRSVISLLFQQNPELQINQNENNMPTIGEIRQDINQFKKLDPSADTKSTLYENIISKLNILEKANKWTNDVNELKKVINQEFYKGFNITTFTDNELKDSYLYNFDLKDATIGNPLQLLYYKSLAIVGSKGIQFGVVDNTYRGNTSTFINPIVGCSINILKNGYYCFDNLNTITMVNKGNQEVVTTKGTPFPTMIKDIATYGNTNMYILTNDPIFNAKGVYIIKYNNLLGSQKDFLEGKEYNLTNSGESLFKSGFINLAIDGTFLMRSSSQKQLYQFWREKNTDAINSRIVGIIGGNQKFKPLSENTKVIASANTNYVYLFDRTNQTVNVYNTTPPKTNENNTSNFRLSYFFRLDIVSTEPLIDIIITESDKPILYGLTKKGIITIKINEFIDSYKNINNPGTTDGSGVLGP